MSRALRRVHLALSLLGLAVGLWGFARLPQLSEFPPGFAPPAFWPVRVGEASAGSAAELRFLVQARPHGSPLALESPEGRQAIIPEPQLTRTHLALTLTDGLLFLLVNMLVFVPRLDRTSARPFYWLTLVTGVSILIGGLYLPRPGSAPDAATAVTWLACLTFLPVFFTRLGLEFPTRRRWLARAPRLPWLFVAVAAILTVWQAAAYLGYFGRPAPAAWRAAALPRLAAQGLLVVGVAGGLFLLLDNLRLVQLTRERQQLKWLIWGFAIGVTPYVFLRTLPGFFGLRSPFGPAFDRVCEMTVPVAFTLAVVRWKFLDIDIIIRRSLVYTTLAAVLTGVYVMIAVLIGARVRELLPATAPYIPVVAALAAAALFTPTRRAIGSWIDRTFFRIRYVHGVALRELEDALPAAAGPQEIAALLCELIGRTLEVRGCAVVEIGGGLAAGGGFDGDAAGIARALLPHAAPAALFAAPGATSLPELESSAFPAELRAVGCALAAPLGDGEAGAAVWLLLGEKRSERRFIEQDLDLVTAAATSAAAALERIRLVRRAADEEVARQRLDEIDRLKNDFLSRVAHDLRTPITSITWSADNLLDGVVGGVNERQRNCLLSMKAAAGQLGRLVSNLLEISRLEVGRPQIEISSVDLRAVVGEAALAMAPIAAARGVRIETDAPAELPQAHGDREKLGEVVANLLENAGRYSPDGAAVEVTLSAPPPSRRVLLCVRDHGPGLGEGEAEFIFDRFRQGRPSPWTAPGGFGLGLYVVKSYVELMGGVVTARNHPGGGAEFGVELPTRLDGLEEGA